MDGFIEGKWFLWNIKTAPAVLWKGFNPVKIGMEMSIDTVMHRKGDSSLRYSWGKPGWWQYGYQSHRLCFPLIQKARNILFFPSIFVLYFNKMWVGIRHSLVKKEESSPVVKLYLLTLDNFALMTFNVIFPPTHTHTFGSWFWSDCCACRIMPDKSQSRKTDMFSLPPQTLKSSAQKFQGGLCIVCEPQGFRVHLNNGSLIPNQNDCICYVRVFIVNKLEHG